MGSIGGLIIYYAGLPNHLSAMGLGYLGIDAIEAVLIRVGRLPHPCEQEIQINKK